MTNDTHTPEGATPQPVPPPALRGLHIDDTYSATDLDAMAAMLAEMAQIRRERAKATLREKFERLAAADGLTLADIVSQGAARKRPVTRYQHPVEPTLRWSGKGRRPQWILDWLVEHGSLDGLQA